MFQLNNKRFFKACIIAAGMLILGASCKKELREAQYPASLTIVNGVNDNSSFLNAYFGNSTPRFYNILVGINPGSSWDYATEKMDQPLTLFRNYDTLNPIKPFLKTSIKLEAGGIFTHFVYGSPTQVKQKTIKEHLPSRNVNDSVAQLRIINLFENRSIDVVQLEPVPGTMVTDLAFEQLTDFMKIPVNMSVKNFRFEVRDHATGAILTTLSQENILPGTISPNTSWLFRARTMLVTGTWTAEGLFSAKATSIGHY